MSRSLTKKFNGLQMRLSGSNARFYAFAAFMTLVFFTGGSSRDDVQSLVLLRPLAVLFVVYALLCANHAHLRGRLFPLYIALAFASLMILQLIPLPPSLWTALPERQIFSNIADLAGIEQLWRPLTLSPSRTLNSLFALAIPIAAMMLYLNLEADRRNQAITIIICFTGFSAFWATFQLAGPPQGPLYFYNITNDGSAVGLFANRNHQAVLLAAAIIMLGWYGPRHSPAARLAVLKFYSSIAAIFVLVPLIFITGSRAGLLLMAPALIAALIMVYFGRFTVESQKASQPPRSQKKRSSSQQIILGASVCAVFLIAALSVLFSRSLAFDRLIGRSAVEELRVQLIPTFIEMIGDYFPAGSGFGSFEYVYRIYEPQELLNPSYLNQAHNDWAQLIIEGGLPAIAIGILALAWAGFQFFRLAKNWNRQRYSKHAAAMALAVMALFLAGSVGDYPLRVPSLITVFAVMACVFRDNISPDKQEEIFIKI